MTKLRNRLQREEGFTLIEDRANSKAAQSNVRAAFPAAEAYFSDYGTYLDAADPDGTAGPLLAGEFDRRIVRGRFRFSF